MERAPLRPVPARPAGPVDPAAAIREVTAVLPTLAPLEARALALVALADRPRPQVADLLGIEEQQLGAVLAAARKELRQTITPLSGSGWCERAEGLISDRLDGAVLDRDARRLDVHLRNCPRCVEHERRLVQATDALLAGVAPLAARPGPAGAPTALVPVDDAGLLEDEALKEGAPAGPARPPPPRTRERRRRGRGRRGAARRGRGRRRAAHATRAPLRRPPTRSRPPPRSSSRLARAASSPRPSRGTRWWPSR